MTAHDPSQIWPTLTQRIEAAGVFGPVTTDGSVLQAQARESGAQAWYFIALDSADPHRAWVGLATPDRWLSESIEADLMHTGDKMEELLAEELCELDLDLTLPVEHFRDDWKRYTFRSPVTLGGQGDSDPVPLLATVLLAYEATFRQLGDMSAKEE